MSNGRFKPLHEAHAIEQVALQVNFDREMTEPEFAQPAWQKYAARVRPALPAFNAEPGIRLEATPTGPKLNSGTMAYSYSRIRPDGLPGLQLRLERVAATLLTTTYTRWASVRNEVTTLLLPMLRDEVLSLGLKFQSVGLAYSDRFIWDGPAGEMRAGLLCRTDSKWVSACVFDAAENWHSHCGMFIRPSPEIRRLLALKIDAQTGMVDGSELRSVAVTVDTVDATNVAGYPSVEHATDAEAITWVVSRLDELHAANKAIFAEILVPDVRDRIHLMSEPADV